MRILKLTTYAIATAATLAVSATTSRAASITDFVDTSDTLSFNFSGNGFNDFVNLSLPLLTYWAGFGESHTQDLVTGKYGFGFDSLQHLPDGPVGLVGGSDTPLGATLSDTQSFAHGTALDTYVLSLTVQNDGQNQWGDFSGSFSAVHVAQGVPDAGSTAVLAGLGFLVIAGARRSLRAH